eukprot:gene10735-10542_t
MENLGLGKVLLVEDDEKLAGLIAHFLSQHGFEVRVVHRGDEALAPTVRGSLAFGQLAIDRSCRGVSLGDEKIDLTTMEFELLWLLASSAGKILSRDDILNRMRGIAFDGLNRSVDVYISKLRNKLNDNPREPVCIKTIWGKGYLPSPMLRLFLRLYIILALGLAGAIWLVNYTFDELLPEANETYNREAMRGPAYGLVEQLRPLPAGVAREARLAELQQHYGLRLALIARDAAALTSREQQLLTDGKLVVRGDFMEFITEIDGGAQLLQIKLPVEPRWLYLWAYSLLGLCLAIVLYFWVRPHWRDLEHIRLAAQRFGDNDLGSRILLPRRSSVRELAGHFNQMAERIEHLIANQRELTNAVSHELRTPIARLSFELDQLKQEADPRQSRALIGDMYADLGELEDMVSELLTYASLERGATQVTRENIEAHSWLDSVIGSVALEAEAEGVQLSLGTCEVDFIQIEPRFMARAVINLLRNAIRYAEHRVEVSLVKFGSGYEVRVCDDGPGVPEDGREKIFQPFMRLDASRDRRTGGFGLGLALVQRVSQWHGGQVQVLDSQWGGA